MQNKILATILILFTIVFSFGCGEKEKPEISNTEEGLVINNPWFRPGSLNRNSALYFEVYNNTDKEDTLFAAESDLAKVVQVHETYNKGNDMKGMRHVDFVVIPAHSKLVFKPGGYHIMLVGLNKDLRPGDTGEVTILFKLNGKIQIRAEVKGK